MERFWILCQKIFSLTLIFNALLTIACSIGILAGLYWFFVGWQPFYPFLINGNVFWAAILAAALNIFPNAKLGRHLETGRFLFHHYFYGFLVLLVSSAYVVIFTPASLLTIFLVNDTSIAVNIGRFFILGGFSLILDDLPDVSTKIETALNWTKTKAHQGKKIIIAAQIIAGTISAYIFIGLCISFIFDQAFVTLANCLLLGSVFITSVTSFIFVKRGAWLNLHLTHKKH